MALLNPDQLVAFKKEGVIVCHGLVPREVTARWRTQIWSTLGASSRGPALCYFCRSPHTRPPAAHRGAQSR